MEDLSVHAMMGYIYHELETKGPCTQQYFTEDAPAEDIDLAMKALAKLTSDDVVLRKGNIFYLPKIKKEV